MRPDLPTGVVTLLFTDIEGSTRLLAELREGYVDALAGHRDVLRSACAEHDGVIVDSQGDAMLMAFDRPHDAVRAAEMVQRGLSAGRVRVRIGIHSGTPELQDGAYVGMDVHRGARIAAAGHGGQVLLSAATRELIEDDVEDLGRHRLKDLDEPEHIYQLSIADLPTHFAPLRTVDADRPRLPAWATSFVGREGELARIAALLDDPGCRIITLVGPGGAGKTRLALEAAARHWHRRRRHTVYVPLVTATTRDQLIGALAGRFGFAIDLAHGAGRSPEDQLTDFLRRRSSLIVADNFEQLLPVANVLATIVERAPEVTLLVTSRSRLDLSAEWIVEVNGLTGVDSPSRPGPAASDGTDPAMRLLVERARQRDPRLTINDDDWPAFARICRLTEAMPLALELAAAWMSVLGPDELGDELERNLDVLTSRAGDAPPRHRSLRAAFDSSWRLLDDEQRRVLSGLSVFRGPFTRQSAATIVSTELTTLAELVTRSLVRRVSDRYEIHDLIHQYASEELAASGAAEATQEAHARAFEARLVSRLDRLASAEGPVARAELYPDVADIRAAAAWAVTRWGAGEVGPLLRGLTTIWAMQVDPGGPDVFRDLAHRVETDRDPTLDAGFPVSMRTKLASHLAVSLASVDANVESDAVIDAHLADVRRAGVPWDIAVCLLAQGMNADNRDENAEAVAPLKEADDLLRDGHDDLIRSDVLQWLGWAHLMLDDIAKAREAFEEALRLADRAGEPAIIAFAQSKMGTLDDAEGRPAAALQRHLAAFASFDAAGNSGGVGYSLSRACLSAYSLGDFRASLDFGQRAYEGFSELGHRWGRTIAAARLAFAYLGLVELDPALRWGLESLRLGHGGVRLGQLYALSAVAAAHIRSGESERWLPVLRATVADPGFPAVFSVQARNELALAEADDLERTDGAEAVDLDAIIWELSGPATRG